MASELEELGRRLSHGGYPEAGKLVTTMARSLRVSRLIPARIPADKTEGNHLVPFQNRKVMLDVDRLREQRLERHVSQRGLALAARLSPSYISNIEAHTPSFRVRWSTLVSLAIVLELPPEDLVATSESTL